MEVTQLHPSMLKVYEGEWFPCSWKIVNNTDHEFPPNTCLEKVKRYST